MSEKDASLKDVVKKLIKELEKREKEEPNIPGAWEKTVGEEAAKHTKPAFLKDKRLVVHVSDSSWLYELTLEKKTLMNKFNENLDSKKKIKELQFRIGQI